MQDNPKTKPSMEFVNFYQDETIRLYGHWRDKRVDVVKHNGQEWLVVTGLDQDGRRKAAEPIHFMPFYEKISEEVDSARRQGEFNNRLAPRIGMYPSELSNMISPSAKKKNYQGVMVNIFLETPKIPTAREADHTLMMLRQPCLYLDSYNEQINRRNCVIRLVLDYAAEQTAGGHRDDRSWVLFLQDVLTQFDLPLTWRPALKDRANFAKTRKPFSPTGDDLALLDRCREALAGVHAQDYTRNRTILREKYSPAGMSVSRYSQLLYERIAQFDRYALSERTVASFFAGNMDAEQNKCTREGVIDIAVAMGCTLEEVNRLLQDINEAVLYPRSSWPEDRQYVDWILKHPYK